MEENLTFDRQIALRRNKYDYVPPPDNTLNFAYEDLRYQKMSDELKFDDNILKLKVLKDINEDFHDASRMIKAIITSDIFHILIDHLTNHHNEIRELASRALVQLCSFQRGREFVISNTYITSLVRLFDDLIPEIRTNAYKSIINLTKFKQGAEAVFDIGVLSILVDKLLEEKEQGVLILVLILMKAVLGVESATLQALKTPIIGRLTQLLSSQNPKIRQYSSINLASLSFLEPGKLAVQREKCAIEFCKLLNDSVSEVREAATISLSSLSQLKEGKLDILENGYFDKVMEMLDEKEEEIVLNVILTIANVAEEPRGREMAKSILPKLKKLKNDKNMPMLGPYAEQTIQVIEWIP